MSRTAITSSARGSMIVSPVALHDDTDGDEVGPSHCDPLQPKERGVFRAMRKVYASFYNLNATLERLRHGIDESRVGMALLVHHSFPDEIEAANGVATGELRGSTSFMFFPTRMVSQVGANSITNPSGGSLPEIVDLDAWFSTNSSGAVPTHIQRSSLLLLGEDTVMTWEDDYAAFGRMFVDIAVEVNRPNTDQELEFEYKKLTTGERVIKQVRHVPNSDRRRSGLRCTRQRADDALAVPGRKRQRVWQPPFEIALGDGERQPLARRGRLEYATAYRNAARMGAVRCGDDAERPTIAVAGRELRGGGFVWHRLCTRKLAFSDGGRPDRLHLRYSPA